MDTIKTVNITLLQRLLGSHETSAFAFSCDFCNSRRKPTGQVLVVAAPSSVLSMAPVRPTLLESKAIPCWSSDGSSWLCLKHRRHHKCLPKPVVSLQIL